MPIKFGHLHIAHNQVNRPLSMQDRERFFPMPGRYGFKISKAQRITNRFAEHIVILDDQYGWLFSGHALSPSSLGQRLALIPIDSRWS